MVALSRLAALTLAALLVCPNGFALLNETNQDRWEKPVGNGPDKDVPGFYVNLGPTGARAILKTNSFVVKYVFSSSPADGLLQINSRRQLQKAGAISMTKSWRGKLARSFTEPLVPQIDLATHQVAPSSR